MPASHAGGPGAIPGESTSADPVVQRQRLLVHVRATMVRVHPGSLWHDAQVRQLAERLGLNPSVCGFDSRLGHLKTTRLGRQLADHAVSDTAMLWVRLPPEPLTTRPRGAVRSARHSVKVEIRGSNPLGDASTNRRGTQSGKAAKLKPSCSVGSTPTRVIDNTMRRLGIGEPKWL